MSYIYLKQLKTTNLENRLKPTSYNFLNLKIKEMFYLVDTIIHLETRDNIGTIRGGFNNNESLNN